MAKAKHTPPPLFSEFHELERERHLKDNSEHQNEQEVTREFTPEQIQGLSSEYIRQTIEIDEKEEALKAETAGKKAEIKELKKDSRILRNKIRAASETSLERVYGFPDFTTMQMTFYDKYGKFVSMRPLLPSERQTSIPTLNSKQGTDNE